MGNINLLTSEGRCLTYLAIIPSFVSQTTGFFPFLRMCMCLRAYTRMHEHLRLRGLYQDIWTTLFSESAYMIPDPCHPWSSWPGYRNTNLSELTRLSSSWVSSPMLLLQLFADCWGSPGLGAHDYSQSLKYYKMLDKYQSKNSEREKIIVNCSGHTQGSK